MSETGPERTEKRLPTAAEMRGIDPEFTGGKGSVECVREMRDDPTPTLHQGEEKREEPEEPDEDNDAPGCILCGNTQADLLQSQPQGLVCRNAGDCSERQAPAMGDGGHLPVDVAALEAENAQLRQDLAGASMAEIAARAERDEAQAGVKGLEAELAGARSEITRFQAERFGMVRGEVHKRALEEVERLLAELATLRNQQPQAGELGAAQDQHRHTIARYRQELDEALAREKRVRDRLNEVLPRSKMLAEIEALLNPYNPLETTVEKVQSFIQAHWKLVNIGRALALDQEPGETEEATIRRVSRELLRLRSAPQAKAESECGECERLGQECARLRRMMSQAATAYDYREDALDNLEQAQSEFEGRDGHWKRMLETLSSEAHLPTLRRQQKRDEHGHY